MRVLLIVWMLALWPFAAMADSCPQFFVKGELPRIVDTRLSNEATFLCYEAFATYHSGITLGALWSAEHLTTAGLSGNPARDNSFHPEGRLPSDQRAELGDYARSGFDRGHMAPSGDMPTPQAQFESFSLANMVPQAPELNRGAWRMLEWRVREEIRIRGEGFVVTGAIFHGDNIARINGRVLVPSHLYKVVYFPDNGEVQAWLSLNTAEGQPQAAPLEEINALSGFDILPAVPTKGQP